MAKHALDGDSLLWKSARVLTMIADRLGYVGFDHSIVGLGAFPPTDERGA